MILELENLSVDPIKWEIDCLDHGNPEAHGAFSLNITSGTLSCEEKIEIKALFNPVGEGIFTQKIPVYVNGDRTKPFSELFMKGEG